MRRVRALTCALHRGSRVSASRRTRASEARIGGARAVRHRWDLTPRAAVALQERLAVRVERRDRLPAKVRAVAGIDVGYEDEGRIARAAAVLLEFPSLRLVDFALVRRRVRFPYVPGLLSFREAPAALAALARLRRRPELVLCDGQGIAHPRRFGLASHIGVLSGIATIGVAKSRLVGEADPPGDGRGDWTPLCDAGEEVGAVLRTRRGARPLYVSIGHRVSLATAIAFTLACAPRYRQPETTRWAHRIAAAQASELARLRRATARPTGAGARALLRGRRSPNR